MVLYILDFTQYSIPDPRLQPIFHYKIDFGVEKHRQVIFQVNEGEQIDRIMKISQEVNVAGRAGRAGRPFGQRSEQPYFSNFVLS